VKRPILLLAVSTLLITAACDSNKAEGDKSKAGEASKADADKAKSDKPSLMLRNDTPACQAALKCCEAMVKATKNGEATPEDINLSCSGVGMADSDDRCEEFKKGYAASLEAKGGELPADCK
jgi:hypothetical protein